MVGIFALDGWRRAARGVRVPAWPLPHTASQLAAARARATPLHTHTHATHTHTRARTHAATAGISLGVASILLCRLVFTHLYPALDDLRCRSFGLYNRSHILPLPTPYPARTRTRHHRLLPAATRCTRHYHARTCISTALFTPNATFQTWRRRSRTLPAGMVHLGVALARRATVVAALRIVDMNSAVWYFILLTVRGGAVLLPRCGF